MIRHLIALAVFVVLTIFGLSVYLQPDDLKDCDKTPSVNSSCGLVDAIVAISGGDTDARADEAISLYKNGWSTKLVFSGAAEDKSGPSNAAVMKIRAINAGVPETAIFLDDNSESTKQNAENTQAIFAEHNIKNIILVTSGYHQRRASLEFNKHTQGVTILNHPTSTDKDWSFWWWASMRGWWLAGSEIAKIIAFYVVGV